MASVGYGKIKDGEGLRQAFQQILASSPPYDCGILRITAEKSGLITIRSGKFITGGAITGSEVTGVLALKELFALTRGLYSYLSAEELPEDVIIDQSLMVDIDAFLKFSDDSLSSGIVKYCWQKTPAIEEDDGWAIERPVSKNKRTSTAEHNFLVAQDPRAVAQSQEVSGRQVAQTAPDPSLTQAAPDPSVEQAAPDPFVAQAPLDPFQINAAADPFGLQAPDPFALKQAPLAFGTHQPDPFNLHETPDPLGVNNLPDPRDLEKADDPFSVHNLEITLPLGFVPSQPIQEMAPSTPLMPPAAMQTENPLPPVTAASASAQSSPDQNYSIPAQNIFPDIDPFETDVELTQDPFTIQPGQGVAPIFPQAQDLQNFRKSQELHNFRQAQEQHQQRQGQLGLDNSVEKLPQWQSQRMAVQLPPDPKPADAPGPPSLLNTMIHNTKRTYMRLAALGQAHPGLAQGIGNASPTDRSAMGKAAQSVRSTAIKMASRVAQLQQRSKRTEDILQKNQMLRTSEIKTNEVLEEKKKKSFVARFDRDTILGACVILVAAGMIFVYLKSTNPLEGVAALVEQGKKDLSRHKLESSIIQFTLALGKKPGDPEILALRARAYEDSGDLPNALSDYQQIIKATPNDIKILTKAALTEYRSEHFDAAIADCEKALRVKNRDGAALAIKAMALSRSGAAKEAIHAAKPQGRAITVPSNLVPLFHGDLGYAYMTLKQPDQAIREYSEGLNDEFKNWRMFAERGQCYMQKGKIKEAVADFKEAINLKSADPLSYNLLGDAYVAAEDYALALKAYEDAVKLTPKPSSLYLKIAHCYFNLKKYGDTQRACDIVLRLAPNDNQAKELRNIAMNKSKSAKPLLIGDRTVFYAPDPQTVPNNSQNLSPSKNGATDQLVAAGYNALTNGNYEKAATLLSMAVSKDGNNFFARRFLGQALLKRGDAQHAYEQFEVVGQKGLLTSADQMEFGKAAQMVGRANKAAEIYEGCVKADPTWVEARVALIKTYVALGNVARASEVADEGGAFRPQDASIFQNALGLTKKR